MLLCAFLVTLTRTLDLRVTRPLLGRNGPPKVPSTPFPTHKILHPDQQPRGHPLICRLILTASSLDLIPYPPIVRGDE